MYDVMIDLETMSSEPTAAIVAIGAVRFKLDGDPPPEPSSTPQFFYRSIILQTCLDIGLTVSGSTVEWWLTQAEEARKALATERSSIRNALYEFKVWLSKDDVLWSHATFDTPILAYAYSKVEGKPPWRYSLCRDVRTIYDLAYPGQLVPNVPDTNKHHALWDAWRQAIGVQQCYKKLMGIEHGAN